MTSAIPQTSKIERTFVSKKTLQAYAVRVLSVLAPAGVDAYSAVRFARPEKRTDPAEPLIPGLPARLLAVDGGAIAAWEWGAGPTVLLVHGWNGLAAQMAPFVAPLVVSGFRVVAFDQPAHGRSRGESATVVDLTEAVLTVAKSVGPIYGVIGHSLGATASALAMGRGLAVERAVLLAPPAEVTHFIRGFGARAGLSPARVEGLLARLRQKVGDLASLDVRRVAPEMRAKLLVMHDPKDREVPFAHGEQIAAAWPGATLVPLERLGHSRMLADKTTIARATRFIEQAAARPSSVTTSEGSWL